MKITVSQPREVVVASVRLDIPLRYLDEEDHIADDFPGRNGERLAMIINMDTGGVVEWPAGRVASVHEKVCDEGVYTLLDDRGETIASRESYVPSFFPGDHCGDYVILDIDATGRVADWRPEQSDVEDMANGD